MLALFTEFHVFPICSSRFLFSIFLSMFSIRYSRSLLCLLLYVICNLCGYFWSFRQVLTATSNPLPSFSIHVLPLPSKVQVLYGGTDLFDYEVRRTFNNDMLLAFISSSCIAALVYILTSCSGRSSLKAFSPPSVLLPGHKPSFSRIPEIVSNPPSQS